MLGRSPGVGALRIVAGLAVRERFGLREQVGEQRAVVLADTDASARTTPMKSTGTIVGALVQRLEEAVLRCRCPRRPTTPARCRRRPACRRGAPTCRGSPSPAAAGSSGSSFRRSSYGSTACVAKPSALRFHTAVSACHAARFVSQRRAQHVRVHLRRAGEQSASNASHADRQRDRQADRRPQRIAAADPVPHRQDAFGRDRRTPARRARRSRVTANRRVSCRPASRAGCAPLSSVSCVPKVFDIRIAAVRAGSSPAQHALRGGAVDVGEEMHAEATRRRTAQRVDHQPRPEVGTADADADDVGDVARGERVDQRAHAHARLRACACAASATGAVDRSLRSAVCSAARPSVRLTCSPSNSAASAPGASTRRASANSASSASRS